ncbi:MAG TPA: hypothetical protein VHU83_05020, partial [Bryobacteraceae bacterium]|nr:hypothetical protein [Bryobacteraceae bacterium]
RSLGTHPAETTQGATPAERRVLYWYDAMNPQHHYDKPGKAGQIKRAESQTPILITRLGTRN